MDSALVASSFEDLNGSLRRHYGYKRLLERGTQNVRLNGLHERPVRSHPLGWANLPSCDSLPTPTTRRPSCNSNPADAAQPTRANLYPLSCVSVIDCIVLLLPVATIASRSLATATVRPLSALHCWCLEEILSNPTHVRWIAERNDTAHRSCSLTTTTPSLFLLTNDSISRRSCTGPSRRAAP